MSLYKCLIVDDEELARNLIKNHLSQLEDFELVAACESAIEASKVLNQKTVDLLFLDIEMPVLSGTDFFKNLIHKPKVIFTTAYRDYALDGFELNAIDYLLKPITFSRFFKSVEKFRTIQQHETKTPATASDCDSQTDHLKPVAKIATDPHLFISKDRKKIKVCFENVLYIESLKDYLKIYLKGGETLQFKGSITAFSERLDHRFARIHRSFIVNCDEITAYTKYDVEIGAVEIPIGDHYKDAVRNKFQ
ncbi:MAG: response regulator transcription factor [Bacteroidota bacterium]